MARLLINDFLLSTSSRPHNPLRVLGDFLIQKSNELEAGAGAGDERRESE